MKGQWTSTVVIALFCVLLIASTACARKDDFEAAPYVPPQYYQCQVASAEEISFAYWSPYNMRYLDEGSPIPGEAIRGVVFVLKDYTVTEYMLRDKDKGYLWFDMIKCFLLNPNAMNTIEPGMRVDVVGINKGPELDNYLEYQGGTLIFEDSVVFPTGAIKLPAEGTEQIPIMPAY